MLVAWAGYVRNVMLCLCVHTRHAKGDDMKARVIIVYIRRQSRLYKDVRGLVLVISVCEVPSVT